MNLGAGSSEEESWLEQKNTAYANQIRNNELDAIQRELGEYPTNSVYYAMLEERRLEILELNSESSSGDSDSEEKLIIGDGTEEETTQDEVTEDEMPELTEDEVTEEEITEDEMTEEEGLEEEVPQEEMTEEVTEEQTTEEEMTEEEMTEEEMTDEEEATTHNSYRLSY